MLSNACHAIRTFFALRGSRIVNCPETNERAAVAVDAFHAAWPTVGDGTELRLTSCSHWPEKSACAQTCVRQIQAAPDGCRVKRVLAKWHEGKKCVFCKESLDSVDWQHDSPGLLRPDGSIADWSEFRPEQIPSVLQTHLPVCWSCCVEETFRSQHPELFD
jgi:hypothetical protein